MSQVPMRIFVAMLAILFAHAVPAHPGDPVAQPRVRGKATVLVQGLGHHSHSVSTTNVLAQRFFDQGLAYVYAFNHQEALHSFRRATILDPRLAMAHWGIALATGPNYNSAELDAARAGEARVALGRAHALASVASESEQAYIAALTLRFAEPLEPDPARAAQDYRDAMRALMLRYPEDPDAATLFADAAMQLRPWRLWNSDGTRAAGTEEVITVLEATLARSPEHIGANHFYIHAIEASPHPERALPSAERLPRLAPAAGHLVHMAAHIYDRIGDHAGSARANALAIAADRAYLRSAGPNPYQGYYAHNLNFLAVAQTMQGRYRDAIGAARQFARHIASTLPEIPGVEGYLPAVALINVRFQRWDEILKLPRPPKAFAGPLAVWHFARGAAFAARGRIDRAEAERLGFAQAMFGMSDGEAWGRNRAVDVLAIARAMCDGYIASASGDDVAAIRHFTAAAAAEDALAYDEPAPWTVPPREALGAALLAAGDVASAEQVFVAELSRRPRSGRALFGLAAALKAQGKPAGAVEEQFASAWKNADTEPGLGRARRSSRGALNPQAVPATPTGRRAAGRSPRATARWWRANGPRRSA